MSEQNPGDLSKIDDFGIKKVYKTIKIVWLSLILEWEFPTEYSIKTYKMST